MPVSGVVCSADGASLPLITAAPISDNVGRASGAWGPPSTAALFAAAGRRVEGAWMSFSAAILLRTGDCGANGACSSLAATRAAPDIGEPTATGAFDGFAASQAHRITAQMPTMADTLAATVALRSHKCRFAEARRLCGKTPGLDAKASGLIA